MEKCSDIKDMFKTVSIPRLLKVDKLSPQYSRELGITRGCKDLVFISLFLIMALFLSTLTMEMTFPNVPRVNPHNDIINLVVILFIITVYAKQMLGSLRSPLFIALMTPYLITSAIDVVVAPHLYIVYLIDFCIPPAIVFVTYFYSMYLRFTNSPLIDDSFHVIQDGRRLGVIASALSLIILSLKGFKMKKIRQCH